MKFLKHTKINVIPQNYNFFSKHVLGHKTFSSLSRIFSLKVFDFASKVKLCFTSASAADLSASRFIAWMLLFHNFLLHSTLIFYSFPLFSFITFSMKFLLLFSIQLISHSCCPNISFQSGGKRTLTEMISITLDTTVHKATRN